MHRSPAFEMARFISASIYVEFVKPAQMETPVADRNTVLMEKRESASNGIDPINEAICESYTPPKVMRVMF